MKSLDRLNNLEKGALLHQLFPEAIPDLLEFIEGMCISIREDEEGNRKAWTLGLSDVPDQPMELKAFDCEVKADFDANNKEEAAYKEIPVIRQVNDMMIQRNYLQIKEDIQFIKETEMNRIINDPDLQHLAIKKGN